MRSSLVVLSMVCAGCGEPQHPTLPFAIEKARDTRRPLVVEFNATWCKPCHVFATQVLPDPRVQAALREVVFVQYDNSDEAQAASMAGRGMGGATRGRGRRARGSAAPPRGASAEQLTDLRLATVHDGVVLALSVLDVQQRVVAKEVLESHDVDVDLDHPGSDEDDAADADR
jgi:hypothetical protein